MSQNYSSAYIYVQVNNVCTNVYTCTYLVMNLVKISMRA